MKVLLALVLNFAFVCCFAAFQYDNYIDFTTGDATGLKVAKDANLTLKFTSGVQGWTSLTVQAVQADGSMREHTVDIKDGAANIGDVRQGETLKFVFTNEKGQSTNVDMSKFWGSSWDVAAGMHDGLVFGGNYGQWNSQYAMIGFQIDGSPITPNPSGQPLPGVLAALLVGGGLAGSRLLLKRRARRG